MTTFRLFSLPTHGALELSLGLALMVSPFLFGFGAAGLVSAFVIGALLVGLALGTATDGGLPIGAHFAADRGIVVGLIGAAALLGLAGDTAAMLGFAVIAAAQALLSVTTRYSHAR